MTNFKKFQPVTPDLLAESYLDTTCIEDYDQAVTTLAQDIEGYVKEANWFTKNQDASSESTVHDRRISIFAARILNATGRMAHDVCFALL